MDYVRFSISNPVKVTVGVLIILLFGMISLFAIPIQLVPNVDKPQINVTTDWTGRSPQEIEREIVEKQENKLKGVSNLRKMISTSQLGRSSIELEFYVGTNMQRALQEVTNKLNEVSSYPDNVDQPVIVVADSSSENAIAWMILSSDDPDFDVQTLYEKLDKRVKPYFERVEGLSEVNIYGAREHQVHVEVDPVRMAQWGITFNQLGTALRQENINISAGNMEIGRQDIRIRTIGQYEDVISIENTIVAYGQGGPVRVKDLATVTETLEKQRSFVHSRGERGVAINAIRESGSNVISVMEQLQARIKEVNENILPDLGPKLKLVQVYDETDYIYDAINLVLFNLCLGGVLAVCVLTLYLRSIRPTMIVSLAIPVSVIGTFVVMVGFGRNLNVVSIAGLSFGVGMVVDSAIVVLENIDRHLGMGKSAARAAYDGAKEVWGAILASTLTTLAVFIPVLMIQEEAGQLFRDISLAICASVSLSLIVAVTVIPTASARWLRPHKKLEEGTRGHNLRNLFGLTNYTSRLSTILSDFIYRMTGYASLSLLIVAAFTLIAIGGAWLLMPPTTYLPSGNRNLVFGIMLSPPGYNIDQNLKMAKRMEDRLRPFWEAETYEDLSNNPNLPQVIHPFTQQPVSHVPPIDNFFFVSFGGNIFYGATSADKQNIKPVEGLLQWSGSTSAGAIPLAFQAGLFGSLGSGNSVDVEVSGDDLDQVREAAMTLQAKIIGELGYGPFAVRPQPGNYNLTGPELQIIIDRVKAADLGIDVQSLGSGVQALIDGLIVGEYRYQGDMIDMLVIRNPNMTITPEDLVQIPVSYVDANGKVGSVPLSSIARIVPADAPQEIRRIEQRRSVTLSVTPPPTKALEQATREIEAAIIEMRKQGQMPRQIETASAGTADKLVQVREALLGRWYGLSGKNFFKTLGSLLTSRLFLSLLIVYLLMSALYESFLYPFVIMFTVPLATLGGFMGLRLIHDGWGMQSWPLIGDKLYGFFGPQGLRFIDPTQQLDVVTMLGFVILVGVVVNNAILIVYQALNFMQGFGESQDDKIEAMPARKAIAESVRTRLRPIMMTTTTSFCGMAPLVIMPGSGSELYRGLGAVMLGGLLVSTLFTLIVVPLLFNLVLEAREWTRAKMGWQETEKI